MALFALYRILPGDDRMHVFLSDIRPEGRSMQHHCTLQCRGLPHNRLSLVKDLTKQLGLIGFPLEFDRQTDEDSEIRYFCVHRIASSDAGSVVDAIRAVCSIHQVNVPRISTYSGGTLPVPNRPPMAEQRAKTV